MMKEAQSKMLAMTRARIRDAHIAGLETELQSYAGCANDLLQELDMTQQSLWATQADVNDLFNQVTEIRSQ